MAPDSKPEGLLAGVKKILIGLLLLGETRFQLFASELQAERLRFIDTMLKLAVATCLAGIGLFLGALSLALYVWEMARYAGLVVMTVLFVSAGFFLLWRLRAELRRAPNPFAKTFNEFKKDRACFTIND